MKPRAQSHESEGSAGPDCRGYYQSASLNTRGPCVSGTKMTREKLLNPDERKEKAGEKNEGR